MEHKCPIEPCDACWEEAKAVGRVLMWLGLLALVFLLLGCASIHTTDCARDENGMWRCHEKNGDSRSFTG